MSVLVLIGRILFALLFISSGYAHLAKLPAMGGYAKMKGVPVAQAATVVSGLMILVGGISVLLGIWADLGAFLLVVFLVPTAVMMHGFWKDTGDARQGEQAHFMKDISLAGAALALGALISYAGSHLGYTITGPLFSIH
jgi:uncharacterized membrane protein YphA (DoxX/SURF4 family)